METKCMCGKGKQYPHLFAPLRVGNIRMKNRIICAPTSPSMIDLNGHFTPEMIAYLEEKAMGARESLHMEKRLCTLLRESPIISSFSWMHSAYARE